MKPNYYFTGGEEPEDTESLSDFIEREFSTDVLDTLDRQRPYNGQSWTDDGIRGKQEVHGLTMRDIKDCFVRACYESAPIMDKDKLETYVLTGERNYPKSIYDLPWEHIDIMAVCQNMTCWIEKYMGIFPNLPEHLK